MEGRHHCRDEYNWRDAVRLESSDDDFAGCSKVRSDAVSQSFNPAFDGEITESQ